MGFLIEFRPLVLESWLTADYFSEQIEKIGYIPSITVNIMLITMFC